ncbi:two-component system response regulator BtsR [Celerinatantimonas sp. MCCC 1A17872]|uniref:two-component system response regulator BtsR n=1 Tax=Celerinatantimonas sp. MCCC 1A17872 TaxID=3177514 RepID=UPI0038C1CAF1
MLNAILVDDEPLAREELRAMLNEDGRVKVVGEFDNAIDCLSQYRNYQPDVLFVDIHMPKIDGLELLSIMHSEPNIQIVLVTAYEDYALKAFEAAAFDYLLKPVEEQRLAKTIERLENLATLKQNAHQSPLNLLPCLCQQRQQWIRCENIEYAFSDLSGVHVFDGQQLLHTQLTLKTLESQLGLMRCHRQYLIDPQSIHHFILTENGNGELVTYSGAKIPVSRRYMRTLKAFLAINVE